MIDEIDKKILELLLKDSRITNIQIAQKIKRSESTVRQRITKLNDNGIIKKFSIIVEPTALGFSTVAFLGINVQPNRLLKILKQLKKFQEIVSISTTTGDYMILCVVWTKNGESLSIIIENIETIEGVIEVLPSIIQERHKTNSLEE